MNGRSNGSFSHGQHLPWVPAIVMLPPLLLGSTAFEGLSLDPGRHHSDASSSCGHATPVAISPNPVPASGEQEFVVAVHHESFSQPDGTVTSLGFDLDNTCTGQGEGP